ncbi:protein cornichon homolog 4-like [Impatiens glandulifera]|uniref:protein cornichon homolog 4-like n=1 Tax=Impatiens glandulifera TaxID=253017 RepID=UPI001FB08B09|nr:protein cornichon homolog 4-like [Impatiens glandulifera]
MIELWIWLISFFLIMAIFCITFFQIICLADLEIDHINPYDSTSRINKAVWPEFIAQGFLTCLHLLSGHWLMFLFCLPYLYYNIRLYTRRQHLAYVTEIFSQLSWQKKQRICKLVYLVVLLCISLFRAIWNIVE